MDKEKLTQFLLKSRTKTYAGGKGEIKPVLDGSTQLEYKEGNYFYRDIYYSGNLKFMGLETIYFKDEPIWSMSYYGRSFIKDEKKIYKFLKEALLEKWQKARIWKNVEWEKGDYKYICKPDFKGSIEEMAGLEEIFKDNKKVYQLFYAGGIIKK